MSVLFDIKDKIIVVTGGLGQLGRQFSTALLAHGARVAVFDVHVDEKTRFGPFWNEWDDGRLSFHPVDVTKRGSIESAVEVVMETWGVPYGLINNAALDSPPHAPVEENGPFETYPERSWDAVMGVNVKGVFLCCQVVGEKMSNAKGGSIISICSTYGMVSPDQRIYEYRNTRDMSFNKPAAYSASKSALLNLTRYMATYWANRNIRVNTLTLGGVYNHQDKEFLDGYCARVPLGRMAREDEYNGAVIFLLSNASSYMTGSNLIMDGGWTAW